MEFQPVFECDFEELLALPVPENKAEVELKILKKNVCILKSKIMNYHISTERETASKANLADPQIVLKSNNDKIKLGDGPLGYNNANNPTVASKCNLADLDKVYKADTNGETSSNKFNINNNELEEQSKIIVKTQPIKEDNQQNGDLEYKCDLIEQEENSNEKMCTQKIKIADISKMQKIQTCDVYTNTEHTQFRNVKMEQENLLFKRKNEILMHYVNSLTKINNTFIASRSKNILKRIANLEKHNPLEPENNSDQNHSPLSTTDFDAFTSEDERDSLDSGLMSPCSTSYSPNPNLELCNEIDVENCKTLGFTTTPKIELNSYSKNDSSFNQTMSVVNMDADSKFPIPCSPRPTSCTWKPVTDQQVKSDDVIKVPDKDEIKVEELDKSTPVKTIDVALDPIQELVSQLEFAQAEVKRSNLTMKFNKEVTQINPVENITVALDPILEVCGNRMKISELSLNFNKEVIDISPVKRVDVGLNCNCELVNTVNVTLDPIAELAKISQESCDNQVKTSHLCLNFNKEVIDISPIKRVDVGLNPSCEFVDTVNVALDPIEELAKISQEACDNRVKISDLSLNFNKEVIDISPIKRVDVGLNPRRVNTVNVALDPIVELFSEISPVNKARISEMHDASLSSMQDSENSSQVKCNELVLHRLQDLKEITLSLKEELFHKTPLKTADEALDPIFECKCGNDSPCKIKRTIAGNNSDECRKLSNKVNTILTEMKLPRMLSPIFENQNAERETADKTVQTDLTQTVDLSLDKTKKSCDNHVKYCDASTLTDVVPILLNKITNIQPANKQSNRVQHEIKTNPIRNVKGKNKNLCKEGTTLSCKSISRIVSKRKRNDNNNLGCDIICNNLNKEILTTPPKRNTQNIDPSVDKLRLCSPKLSVEDHDVNKTINGAVTDAKLLDQNSIVSDDDLNTHAANKDLSCLKEIIATSTCKDNQPSIVLHDITLSTMDHSDNKSQSSPNNILDQNRSTPPQRYNSQISLKIKSKYNDLFGSDDECDIPDSKCLTNAEKTNIQGVDQYLDNTILRNVNNTIADAKQSVENNIVPNNTKTDAKQSVENNIVPNNTITDAKQSVENNIVPNNTITNAKQSVENNIVPNNTITDAKQSVENNIVPNNTITNTKQSVENNIVPNNTITDAKQSVENNIVPNHTITDAKQSVETNIVPNNTITNAKQSVENNIVPNNTITDAKQAVENNIVPNNTITDAKQSVENNIVPNNTITNAKQSVENNNVPNNTITDANQSVENKIVPNAGSDTINKIKKLSYKRDIVNSILPNCIPVVLLHDIANLISGNSESKSKTNNVLYQGRSTSAQNNFHNPLKRKLNYDNLFGSEDECHSPVKTKPQHFNSPHKKRLLRSNHTNIQDSKVSPDKMVLRSSRQSVEKRDMKKSNDTITNITYDDLDLFNIDDTSTAVNTTPITKTENSYKDNVFCNMLMKYGLNKVNNIRKNDDKSFIEKVCADIEKDIANILSQKMQNTKEMMLKLTHKMRKLDRKVFLSALIHFLQDEKRKSDVICKRYTPPAPAMTKPEQVLLFVLNTMAESDKNIISDVLCNIEYVLFRLNYTPEFYQVELLSHFYAVLCRFTGNKSRLRIFMLDAMYCLTFKATVLIQECLNVWMNVLPLAHMNEANNPLVKCFVYLLHYFKCEDNNKLQNLRFQLKRSYSYDMVKWNQTIFLEYLQNCFAELRDNSLERKTLRMCLLILSKRHGARWCEKNIINNILIPLVEDSTTKESTRSFCISMLGPLMRPFPQNMKLHIDLAISKLKNILSEKCSAKLEESVVTSLIHISNHHTAHVMRILMSWQPQYKITKELEMCFKEFITSRPVSVWLKLLQDE